jgi:hypothetical protein
MSKFDELYESVINEAAQPFKLDTNGPINTPYVNKDGDIFQIEYMKKEFDPGWGHRKLARKGWAYFSVDRKTGEREYYWAGETREDKVHSSVKRVAKKWGFIDRTPAAPKRKYNKLPNFVKDVKIGKGVHIDVTIDKDYPKEKWGQIMKQIVAAVRVAFGNDKMQYDYSKFKDDTGNTPVVEIMTGLNYFIKALKRHNGDELPDHFDIHRFEKLSYGDVSLLDSYQVDIYVK